MAGRPDDPELLLEAFEQVLSRMHCSAQQAGLETLIAGDLSFSQARALLVLAQVPAAIPIHELAAQLNLSVAAAGRNIDRLVNDALVDRTEDGSDRRVKRVRLTPAGTDLVGKFLGARRATASRLLASIAPEDRARLLAALQPLLSCPVRSEENSV